MSGAFSAANDVLFLNPEFGVDAVYAPKYADPFPVRLIWAAPDEAVRLGAMATRLSRVRAEVRVSEVADPKAGDEVIVAETTYTVGDRERDDMRLNWRLDLKEKTQP